MKLEKIKLMLQSILQQFNSLVTDKGTLTYTDDILAEGTNVRIVDEEGNESIPEDGEYYLGEEDGRTLVVEGGIVKEIKEDEKEVEEVEEPVEAEEQAEEAEKDETADKEIAEEIADEIAEVAEEVKEEEVKEDENEQLKAKIAELEALVEELKAKIATLEENPADESAQEKFRKQKKVFSNQDEQFNNLMRFAKK